MAVRQTPAMEDYLECIIMLMAENKPVTVTEISHRMSVKMPTVVYALRKLSEQTLVEYNKRSPIKLTRKGKRLGKDVFRRHEALRLFLIEILGVAPATSAKDACKMEHFLSSDSLKKLNRFLEFMLSCPYGRPDCLRGFDYYTEHGQRPEGMLARCKRDGLRSSTTSSFV